MKKLLFVNGHLNIGGVEKSLVDLLKNIDLELFEVDLVLFEEIGDYADEVPNDVNIIFYDLTRTYGSFKHCMLQGITARDWFSVWLRMIFLLSKKIKARLFTLAKPLFKPNKRYDCAIAYRVGICTDFVGYIVNSKKKVSWWHHGEYDLNDKMTKRLSETYKKFDSIVAVSDSSKKLLNKSVPGIYKKLVTIPNIVDCDEIIKKAHENYDYGTSNSGHITLLSMGRLSPEKGMINCVHACKKLIDSGYKVKWYLIGEGVQRSEIEECISDYNLHNDIYLLGSQKNPYPYLKGADIFVHPSYVESLSLTVLEAFALNTPVVAVRSMGPMEYIRDKENGLLVEATPDGLCEGIINLITDKNLYNRLKEDKSDDLRYYRPESVIKKVYVLFS